MSKRKSLMTPIVSNNQKGRKSMLGFTSAHAKKRGDDDMPEARKLFSSARKSVTGTAKRPPIPPQSASRLSTSSRWSMGGVPVKDTRPLTSKAYQKLMVQETVEFLNESGYPHLINVKILSSPSTKEFLRVFEHLFNFIFPQFTLDQKEFAEQIPILMKNISFPFQISKSTMRGIGSLHAWPTILGVLHWLVELIRTTGTIDIEQMLFSPALQEDFRSTHKQLFFQHSAMTYVQFLLGQEDFNEENNNLENAASRLARCSSFDDFDALETEVSNLEFELSELEGEPDILANGLKRKMTLEESVTNCQQSIDELDKKNARLQVQHNQQSTQVQEEIEGYIIQLGNPVKQAELKRKSSEIEAQIDRLNAEKDRLEQLNDEKELRFSKIYNKFSTAATEYNDIATKLTTNTYVKNSLGKESIVLNFDHSKDVLKNYKDYLKPLLVKLSHQISEDRFKLEGQKISETLKLDKLRENLSIKRNFDLVSLKSELANIEKDVVSQKEIEKKSSLSVEELKKVECLIDEKLQEAIAMLEDSKEKLTIKQRKCDELHRKQLDEQNTKFSSVRQYATEIVEHKRKIEDRIDQFNGFLLSEIDNLKNRAKEIVSL